MSAPIAYSSPTAYIDADGVEYVAVEHGGCDGCAFTYGSAGCADTPPCGWSSPKGLRSIIWVRKEGGDKDSGNISFGELSSFADTQPRYVAYCIAHGAASSAAMLRADRERFPGGVMTGYILWINERWREWHRQFGHLGLIGAAEHAAFDGWLAGKFFVRTGA